MSDLSGVRNATLVRLRRESMEQFYANNPAALKVLAELPKSELLYNKLTQLRELIEGSIKNDNTVGTGVQ